MKKYKTIKFIAGPFLQTTDRIDYLGSSVNPVDDEVVNDLLSAGYEFIQIVEHHSDIGTATMLVLGKE